MTNNDVIRAALGLLSVLHVGQSLSAEDADLGLTVMNEMLAFWEVDGVDLSYFEQDDINADSPIQSSEALAVKYSLAIMLAPHYGKTVTPEIGLMAATYYAPLKRDAIIAKATPADMTHLPQGDAQWSTFDITTGQ